MGTQQIHHTEVLIVGCSIAGLASAATMVKNNIPHIVIEKTDEVCKPWRNHYDRLHLHTDSRLSYLPYRKFDKGTPKYPSKNLILEYMDRYQQEFDINPILNTAATNIYKKDNLWITETNNGVFQSKYVIIATGPFGSPKSYSFKGQDNFVGQVIHSSKYKTGKDFKDQNVLVVGFGNSACEIAIDLYEQGAKPIISVRSPVNVLPREVLGIPTLSFGLVMSYLPPRLVDKMNEPLLRMIVGDITKVGLKKSKLGPIEDLAINQKTPLLDVGIMKLLKEGKVKIFDDIDYVDTDTVYFKDGENRPIDAIVAAIGYNFGTRGDVIQIREERFEDIKQSVKKQKFFGEDGLYFNGFWVSDSGQFREIRLDALRIVKDIQSKRK